MEIENEMSMRNKNTAQFEVVEVAIAVGSVGCCIYMLDIRLASH